MPKKQRRKLDLKIIPAIAPSVVAVSVALIILGNHIGILIISLTAGYFSYLVADKLIDFASNLKRNHNKNKS